LNGELLVAAHQRNQVDVERVRVDTTVVEADIKYPTDSRLLTPATCRMAGTAPATRWGERQVRRSHGAGPRFAALDWSVRRGKAEVLTITGQFADGRRRGAGQRCRRSGRRIPDDLALLVERSTRVIDQARAGSLRLAACASRLVWVHESDARPIRTGRPGKPVDFGYNAQVIDHPDGLILNPSVHSGNPADNELLRPGIERITTQFGRATSLSSPSGATETPPSRTTSPSRVSSPS
jgi:IS5 family transposase